jgi:small subunit ribosomal protein S16
MAVKIRMSRMGRRHRPFFRINVIDSRTPRDGRVLEKLGHYDPLEKEAEKQLVLNTERAMHWLSLGAVPSDTVSDMLVKLGVKHKYAEERARKGERARAIAKKKGKPFDKAQRAELQKRLDADKAAADAAAKAAAEAEKAKAAAEAEKAKAAAEAEKAKADAEAAEAGSGE